MNFELSYVKSKSQPFSAVDMKTDNYDPMEVSNIQFYNPLYSSIFQLDDNNYNTIELNHKYYLYDKNTVKTYSNHGKRCSVFIKYSPLLDPIHYLIGKYEKSSSKVQTLPNLSNKEECVEKVTLPNNASYVDNFFNYLSSQMLHHHNMYNAIDYFGSNVAIQKRFRINVYDDIEYLQESDFFLKNNDVLYSVEEHDEGEIRVSKNTQSRRPKLNIANDNVLMNDVIECDDDVAQEDNGFTEEVVYENEKEDSEDSEDDSVARNSSDEENSDTEKNTDDDEDSEEEDSEEEDSGEEDSEIEDSEDDDDDDDDELYAYIYNFPVQMIALEKCDGTFDQLLENEQLDKKQIASALMQIIFTLITYQKAFSFTHNDLHTNNVLYKETSQKYISYKYKNQHYKVPTHGRIFKIIDFGRSIYRFGKHILCTQSFAPGGDAYGQYNTEPYLNDTKARLEPNRSFDLCRLGCSMYDFVFDSERPLPKKMDDIQRTVLRWCQDDYGKNVLYMRNGQERYPNFKLYKMISRLVHKHKPEDQLEFPLFNQFLVKSKCPKECFDIDKIPCYY